MKRILSIILCLCLAINVFLLPPQKAKASNGIIKVLAIGNSFSEDALELLETMAAANGVDMLVANMKIGSASLVLHWDNARNSKDVYTYFEFYQGKKTQTEAVSIKTALDKHDWDFVSLQQVSVDSGRPETYQPYLKYLSDYVYKNEPNAEQLFHQTWAYERDYSGPEFNPYQKDQVTMFNAIKETSLKFANLHGMRIVPCGQAVQNARGVSPFIYEKGGISLNSDGRHVGTLYGRYLLSSVWFEVLTGKSSLENQYKPAGAKAENLEILKNAAHNAVEEYKKPVIKSIEMKSAPTQVNYFLNNKIDLTGGQLNVNYMDGTSSVVDLNEYMLTTPKMNTLGKETISIRYGNKTTNFDINIISDANVKKVIAAIKAIKLTNIDAKKVEEAKKLYDALTPVEKAAVTNYATLEKAMAELNKPTASKPTASPAAGKAYKKSVTVKLITKEKGATIYYTTNGKAPTTKSAKYSKTIKLTKTTTIKAFVTVKGKKDSPVASFKYTITK